jgi:FkbM family methyltransferase
MGNDREAPCRVSEWDALRHIFRRAIAQRQFPRKYKRRRWRSALQFDRMLQTLKAGDIAIDCGANLGKITRALLATPATIYAFEPEPYCFTRLRETTEGAPNLHLFNKAVSTCDGKTMLYRRHGFETEPERYGNAGSLFASKRRINPENAIEVEQIDLAAFILGLPKRVALLKMDIEGAEVPVLLRLLETGAIDRVANAFVEMHEDRIPELAHQARVLRQTVAARGLSHINLAWG